jgi:hypothetical protein
MSIKYPEFYADFLSRKPALLSKLQTFRGKKFFWSNYFPAHCFWAFCADMDLCWGLKIVRSLKRLLEKILPKNTKSCTAYSFKHKGWGREKRDLERKCWENIEISVKVVCCVHNRPASTVESVLRSVALQDIHVLCRLACFVHNRPPSPKFQIFPSQLRLTADRAASLSIKGLWVGLGWFRSDYMYSTTSIFMYTDYFTYAYVQ